MHTQTYKKFFTNIQEHKSTSKTKECFFVFCFYSSYRILYHPRQLVWVFSSTIQTSAVQCLSSNSRCLGNLQTKREKCYGLDVQRQGIHMHRNELFNTTNSDKSSVIEYKIQKLKTTCPQSTLKLLR